MSISLMLIYDDDDMCALYACVRNWRDKWLTKLKESSCSSGEIPFIYLHVCVCVCVCGRMCVWTLRFDS